jgi:hypothetical protein
MSTYLVVITPEALGDTPPGVTAQATIRVETSPPTPRITEMTIRSTAPDGLFASSLPSIDLEGVVQALVAGVRHTTPAPAPQRAEKRRAAPEPSSSADQSGPELADPEPLGPEPLGPEPLGPEPSSPEPSRSEPSRSEPSSPEAAAGNSGRSYRRMPDVDEVRAVFDQVGTVTGLAEHYGVPRHTAQGWMSRIRKMAT